MGNKADYMDTDVGKWSVTKEPGSPLIAVICSLRSEIGPAA